MMTHIVVMETVCIAVATDKDVTTTGPSPVASSTIRPQAFSATACQEVGDVTTESHAD